MDSIDFGGLPVKDTEEHTVTVSAHPYFMSLEVNIKSKLAGVWSDSLLTDIETVIGFIQQNFDTHVSYNVLFDVANKQVKVICRNSVKTIHHLYGIHLLPSEERLQNYAKELKTYLNH